MYRCSHNNSLTKDSGVRRRRRSVLRILFVSMLGFGVFVGLIFPPFAKIVLDAPDAISLRFMVMCITAGLIVGIVNFLLFKILVSRELEYLARGMEHVNKEIGKGLCGRSNMVRDAQLNISSEDIIGDVVQAFNSMSKTIVNRFNQDQLLRDLMSRLSSSVNLSDSSRIILEGFIEATGSYGGVLYARVEQDLELQAVDGIDSPGELPGIVQESDGPVDKAICSGQVVDIMSGEEKGEWVTVSTPLADFKPEKIKIVPLQLEKNTIALVVLIPGREADKETECKVEDLRNSLTPYLENIILYQKIQELAAIDSLTGIYNRRLGEQRLEEALTLCDRKNLPLNLLMLDIDHFKQINDSYGHVAGDAVLKELAGYLKESLRKEEIACRFGGEEFLIIMPNTKVEEAISLAHRLRRGVETMDIKWGDTSLKISTSIGIANWPVIQTQNTDALIKAVDDALYFAKEKGRNLVALNEVDQGEINLVKEKKYSL
ncbi:MAG: GGDEF domain-containing protein [Desulfurivibrionaceae bacterium]